MLMVRDNLKTLPERNPPPLRGSPRASTAPHTAVVGQFAGSMIACGARGALRLWLRTAPRSRPREDSPASPGRWSSRKLTHYPPPATVDRPAPEWVPAPHAPRFRHRSALRADRPRAGREPPGGGGGARGAGRDAGRGGGTARRRRCVPHRGRDRPPRAGDGGCRARGGKSAPPAAPLGDSAAGEVGA